MCGNIIATINVYAFLFSGIFSRIQRNLKFILSLDNFLSSLCNTVSGGNSFLHEKILRRWFLYLEISWTHLLVSTVSGDLFCRYSWASPFIPFSNGYLPFVSTSTNGQMTNFFLLDEQTVNGLRKIFWASLFCFLFEMATYTYITVIYTYIYLVPFSVCSKQLKVAVFRQFHFPYTYNITTTALVYTVYNLLPFQYIYIHVYIYIYMENRTNRKRNFPFVCCKWKTETANFCLFAAYGRRKFVFLGQQTINSNRRLLFQQTCPSMPLGSMVIWDQLEPTST